MNRILEILLLSLVVPAVALAAIVGIERGRRVLPNEGPQAYIPTVTPPKSEIVRKRKR